MSALSNSTSIPAWTNYLDEVPESGWQAVVRAHLTFTSAAVAALPADKATYAYAPGKWTVAQLVGHVLVSQRVFVSRAVVVARGETQPLPGYDENAYALGWPADDIPLSDLAAAYAAEAAATAAWISILRPEELEREGAANNLRIRPSWMFRALVGHENHHLGVLRERYGISA
ncbi:MAG TPA: DinB family protein [Fibrobacteria bacterium]|nr:DinB family protein [Fibrobacteria bacterium]